MKTWLLETQDISLTKKLSIRDLDDDVILVGNEIQGKSPPARIALKKILQQLDSVNLSRSMLKSPPRMLSLFSRESAEAVPSM